MKVESSPWRTSENTVEQDDDDEKFVRLEVFGNRRVKTFHISKSTLD